MVAYWSGGRRDHSLKRVWRRNPTPGATAYLWRSLPRGALEDPDHVTASQVKISVQYLNSVCIAQYHGCS